MRRTPEIMADAAHAILTRPAREFTGNFFIDEEVLRAKGSPTSRTMRRARRCAGGDFFVPDEVIARSPTGLKIGY